MTLAQSPAHQELLATAQRVLPGGSNGNVILPPEQAFVIAGGQGTRVYDVEDARAFLSGEGIDADAIAPQIEDKFMSAFIRATKPNGCCGCSRRSSSRGSPSSSFSIFSASRALIHLQACE